MRQETGVPRDKPIHRLRNGAWGDVAQLVQHLPGMREALGSVLGMADICCDSIYLSSSTWEVVEGGGRSQVYLWLHGEFEASLGYTEPRLKMKQ